MSCSGTCEEDELCDEEDDVYEVEDGSCDREEEELDKEKESLEVMLEPFLELSAVKTAIEAIDNARTTGMTIISINFCLFTFLYTFLASHKAITNCVSRKKAQLLI